MDETTQLLLSFVIDTLATVAAIVEETIKHTLPAAAPADVEIELIKIFSK